jgi:hypothetical protein
MRREIPICPDCRMPLERTAEPGVRVCPCCGLTLGPEQLIDDPLRCKHCGQAASRRDNVLFCSACSRIIGTLDEGDPIAVTIPEASPFVKLSTAHHRGGKLQEKLCPKRLQ